MPTSCNLAISLHRLTGATNIAPRYDITPATPPGPAIPDPPDDVAQPDPEQRQTDEPLPGGRFAGSRTANPAAVTASPRGRAGSCRRAGPAAERVSDGSP